MTRAHDHATARPRAVPIPSVEGPLPGSPPGDPGASARAGTYPWFACAENLAAAGYVEHEFLIAGEADAYDDTGTELATGIPYRTRILMRRPIDPAAFSGTVLVEWLNVTGGHDSDVLWNMDGCQRDGHCWVGVSAQQTGVNALRAWSPARYGELDMSGNGRFEGDELSYDVFSQAAMAITEPGTLGPLTARTVLAIGASQSASYVADYYDHIRPLTAGVFDGYACVIGPAPKNVDAEPVFQVLSETDVPAWWPGAPDTRPPDTDSFRRWEVAGASHADWHSMQQLELKLARDGGELPEFDCAKPPFSRVPLHYVVATALTHLARWARDGITPPTADPLLLDPDGNRVRDPLGLARGGIRLSQVDVPTAVNTGENDGPGPAFLAGSHEPLSREQLAERYPTPLGYLLDVARTDWKAVRAGHIHQNDARKNLQEAAAEISKGQ